MDISLRDYYKEIDSLITNGHFSQAVIHAGYILDLYPKNFDAYLLSGKANLEEKNFTQAADIFTRALAVRPEDFIANIGMSCVREEEGNLNAAIAHMERAFELDSSVEVVQAELIRMYALRDNTPPQKIQLTKGALVRMYVRGGLLQQAINEIQMKFPDLDDRPDIQSLLAGLYYQTGQEDDAIDLSSQILIKLPYCFDANLIMFKTAGKSGGGPESDIFLKRLIELDPYYAFVENPDQDVASVPDDAVMVVHNDDVSAYVPPETSAIETSSVAVSLTPTEEPPAAVSDDQATEDIKGGQPESEDQPVEPTSTADLPDWMKESDLKPEIENEETTAEETGKSSPENVIPADIPDWVKDMSPEDSEATQGGNADLLEKDDLSKLLFTDVETGDIDEDLSTAESQPISAEEVQEESTTAAVETDSSIPEWLKGFDPTKNSADTMDSEKPLPEWLETEAPAESPQSKPFILDDLSELEDEESVEFQGKEPTDQETIPPQGAVEYEKPEWLRETSIETDIDSLFSSPETTADETIEPPDWLNQLRSGTADQPTAVQDQTPRKPVNWLPEEEPQIGDTQPVAVNKPQESPAVDEWAPEHTESESLQEAPALDDASSADLAAFFEGLSQQEKKTGEFTSDTLESQPLDFEFSQGSVIPENSPSPTSPPVESDISSLMDYYSRQIQTGQDFAGIITGLEKLTGENPAEPGLWLLLGEAYHHEKQIQSALNAYARAEECLTK